MVSTGQEQRTVLIPNPVNLAISEDIVTAMPALRRIDCFLEVLVDGDSSARSVIATAATLDENGISPAVVDFSRLVGTLSAEELPEIFQILT